MSKKIIKYKAIYNLYKLSLIALHRKNSLFIDCGSNIGQGFDFFRKYLNEKGFDYILIEPNHECINTLKQKYKKINNLKIMEAAVWTDSGEIKLYGTHNNAELSPSLGSSIIENHNNKYHTENPHDNMIVKCIDFPKLILDSSRTYDFIIIKMDIESAEYAVLKKLIDTGAISYINHLFVEFHSRFYDSKNQVSYAELENNLIKSIKSKGSNISRWY